MLCIFLPATTRQSNTLLHAQNVKDKRLVDTKSPRIIFIGGSNISFGLNSQMIKDTFGLNPVNTGLHAGMGLIYMLNHHLPHVLPGDIIIVSPEYVQFSGEVAYGQMELLNVVLDVTPADKYIIKPKQWFHLISYFPKYAFTKLNPFEYAFIKVPSVYGINSFNEYGDVLHNRKPATTPIPAYLPIEEAYNPNVMEELYQFNQRITEKQALLFITFPALHSDSYENRESLILIIEAALKQKGFNLLGTPGRYKVGDIDLYNSHYHLSNQGSILRTQLLIEDLKNHERFQSYKP